MRKPRRPKVDQITKRESSNGLPSWVKEQTATRGYGDATEPLGLIVKPEDIDNAFACAAQGDGSNCVMAQAATRIGAEHIYFYRTSAWVDFGTGPIRRFLVPNNIYRNIIEPFDRSAHDEIMPGHYVLLPPTDSQSIRRRREYDKTKRTRNPSSNPNKKVLAHTERLVMAHHV
jgi:hypothetical protein